MADTNTKCNVLGIDLSKILLYSDGTRKCFTGNLDDSFYYYFEVPIPGCGMPSTKKCSELGENVLDYAHIHNYGEYDENSWTLGYYNNKRSLEVTFSNNNDCIYSKSGISNRIIFQCNPKASDESTSNVKIIYAGVYSHCSHDFVIPIKNEKLCSTNLPPILSPTNITTNCSVLGYDLSSIILNSDGTRKCFTANYFHKQLRVFWTTRFEIPLCGIPSNQCSQVGNDKIDLNHNFNLGSYDPTSWSYELFLNSKPSLVVTYSHGACPSQPSTQSIIQVRIYCYPYAISDDAAYFSNPNYNHCINSLLIATSNKAICKGLTSVEPNYVPSLVPIFSKTVSTYLNYTVLFNSNSTVNSCVNNPNNCTLHAAWNSCLQNISLNGQLNNVFNCFINIEPYVSKNILPLSSELNFDFTNLTSHPANSTTIHIYINGHNNIIFGNSKQKFLNMVINNSNIEITVVITDLTISSFTSNSTSGGAISMVGYSGIMNLMLENVEITHCVTSLHGGGLHLSNLQSIRIHNSRFINNHAYESNGGAIYILSTQSVIISNSYVFGNSASMNGGGVYVSLSLISLLRMSVDQNTASNGGGIYLYKCNHAQLSQLNITQNNVLNNGGGIYIHGSNGFILSNSKVVTNRANEGGGVYITTNAISFISNILLVNNLAQSQGGGIYAISASDFTFSNSEITSNRAGINGGGAMFYYTDDIILRDLVFDSNFYGGEGGGLYVLQSNFPYIVNVRAMYNEGGIYGGGIVIDSCTQPFLSDIVASYNAGLQMGGGIFFLSTNNIGFFNSSSFGNYASYAAGVYIVSNAMYGYLTNLHIYDNQAIHIAAGLGMEFSYNIEMSEIKINGNIVTEGTGGGVYLQTCEQISMKNIQIYDNFAYAEGGGIFLYYCYDIFLSALSINNNNAAICGGFVMISASTIFISDSTVEYNFASVDGGGIYMIGSTITMQSLQIVSNTATLYGGGLYCDTMSIVTAVDVIISNNEANEGGGIYLKQMNSLVMANSSFHRNHARLGNGGSISAFSGNVILISRTNFDNEIAMFNGGAISLINTNILTVNKCSFSNCAARMGGTLYSKSSNNVTMTNSQFVNSYARDCGALSLCYFSNTIMTNISFHNSLAIRFGGDICLIKTNSTILDAVTSMSASANIGGGVFYLQDDSNTHINNSSFIGSTSKYGSVIYVDGQTFSTTLFNNEFKRDTAYAGGILFLRQPILYDQLYLSSNVSPSRSITVTNIMASNLFVDNSASYGNIFASPPCFVRYGKVASSTGSNAAVTLYMPNGGLLNFSSFQILNNVGEEALNVSAQIVIALANNNLNGTCAPSVHNPNGRISGNTKYISYSHGVDIPNIGIFCYSSKSLLVNVSVNMSDIQQILWMIFNVSILPCASYQTIMNDVCINKTATEKKELPNVNGIESNTIQFNTIIVVISVISVCVAIIAFLAYYYVVLRRKPQGKLSYEDSVLSTSNNAKYFQVTYQNAINQPPINMYTPCIDWTSIDVPYTIMENALLGRGSFGSVIRVKLRSSRFTLGETIDDEEIVIKLFSRFIQCNIDTNSFDANLKIALCEIKSQLYAESKIINKGLITKVYGIVCGNLSAEQSEWLHLSDSINAIGIAMRYERGGTLKDLIYPPSGKSLNLSVSEKLRILCEIARGLSELHSIGVVHGDIKPDNILFSDVNLSEVRLADFGLSAIQEDSNLEYSSLIETAHFRGTPVYAAPELLTNVYADNLQSCNKVAKPSRKSDQYAFAILMWEFITEKKPFDDIKNSVMLCSRVHQGYRPLLKDIPPEYPNKLKDMLSCTWDKDRGERKSAIECFQILKIYYEYTLHITSDVYLVSHPDNQIISSFIWHRLTQQGLNVEQRSEQLTGQLNAKIIVACLTKDFQNDSLCIDYLKLANDLTCRRLVVPLLLEADAESWVDEDVYYYCQMRSQSTIKFDISQIMLDEQWINEKDPDQSSWATFCKEIDRLSKYLYIKLKEM